MYNTVFLNSKKVDFDNKLDFMPLSQITKLTKYDESKEEEIIDRVKDQNIVITKEIPIGKDLISKFPSSVKLICEAGTGYNNIDIDAAKAKNITVCNIPGYSGEAVAQLAITFILNLTSSMAIQQNMVHDKNYDNFTKHLLVPHMELLNKTLGVIGSGSIGNHVIKIARSLGMKVLVHSRTEKSFEDKNIRFASLDTLLKESDFVSIHCPLTPATKHLINKEKLQLMKPSSFIINTSRGAIIKEDDLIEALQNKVIAGAGLDVQEQEPPALDNPLLTMNNVILTPHIGWKCIESRQRLIGLLADNIKAFADEKPINVVG